MVRFGQGSACREDRSAYHSKRHSDGSEIHQRDILDVYIRSYVWSVGPDFILMDDNARPHRARMTNEYLQAETIYRPQPHVWDMLQVAVSARPVKSSTIQDIRQALLDEWVRIPQGSIRRLSSMRRRCQAVSTPMGTTHNIEKILSLLVSFKNHLTSYMNVIKL